MDKLKRYAKKLYDRFMRGADGQQPEEVKVAKTLFDKLIDKYGWDEKEFTDSEKHSLQQEVFRLEFVPEISYAKNPNWFKTLVRLLSVHFDSEVITFSDKLGCLLLGEETKIELFRDDINFVLTRSKRTYDIISHCVAGKKPKRADYFLGFAVGYNQSKIEDEIAEQSAQVYKAEALSVISLALANIETEINDMKASSKAKLDDSKQEIKDQKAYILGYHDGLLSKKRLLKK